MDPEVNEGIHLCFSGGDMAQVATVILAAGRGTRMKSKLPKVLHPVAGRPMLQYVIDTVQELGAGQVVVVVGHEAERVRAAIGREVSYVVQEEQLGTGHAVLQARSGLEGHYRAVLVVNGDMPLLSVTSLRSLVALFDKEAASVAMLTCVRDDAMGFGRIVRMDGGAVAGIVEEKHATPEQLAIRELNMGVYCFRAPWLWQGLEQVQASPRGEYYLTDVAALAVGEGRTVVTQELADPVEGLGVNDRLHLATVERIMRRRVAMHLMLRGVTIEDPNSTYADAQVVVGKDTVLCPHTFLQGNSRIGSECRIGPGTVIRDSVVGDRCEVELSVVEGARLEDEVTVGPFAHLRQGAHLAQGVHMGNFGEVKNAYLGSGTKMGHFGYIGDAQVGQRVNIGAGTITCNFDGKQKHKTVIDDGAFIGSDTMLRAPVRVGARARTGAGSVVTHDVPPDATVVGVPARPVADEAASKQGE
jgi:bifunctional UDP-N-acetylglucosamine pyrophosphorylase/glucosamine-1-phosphate N-acetyltransferase